ncbi:serine/threonine-protein kinase 52-like [Rutidosis leptorrhynchoides]|uniref:serine/threonine-protein kinase 52-like n=1 Tax=Rutidosis leptorrhynchoides TaxID=125765 RepID=UPI003A99E2EA
MEDSIDPLKLVLGQVIGRGACGIVHKGLYVGKTVAVKFLDLSYEGLMEDDKEVLKNEFKIEAGLWKNLHHPNITKMIGATMSSMKTDSGQKMNEKTIAENNFCIVSEYVKRGSLRSYLDKHQLKKLPIKIAIRFALDIAKGLSYLHDKKIIHRDLKPGNMLVDKNRTIKLIDFGVSIFHPYETELMSNQVGTLCYMAPEVMSKKPYGPKCDVYSFGICLWEIYCCDRVSIEYGLNKNITAEKYEKLKPSIPGDCPKQLSRLMEQCWDTDPRKRPNMEDVVMELEEILQSVSGFGCFWLMKINDK